jgi:hypothetical protein
MHVFLENIKCRKQHTAPTLNHEFFHKLVQHTFQVPTNLNERNYAP